MSVDAKSYKQIWCGALGGLLGAPFYLIGSTLRVKFKLGYVPYRGATAVAALPYLLPIGAVLGAIVGAIIWVFSTTVKAHLSAITRAAIGVCFIFLAFRLMGLIPGDRDNGFIAPTPTESLVDWLSYVTFFGMLPGLMAFERKPNRSFPR